MYIRVTPSNIIPDEKLLTILTRWWGCNNYTNCSSDSCLDCVSHWLESGKWFVGVTSCFFFPCCVQLGSQLFYPYFDFDGSWAWKFWLSFFNLLSQDFNFLVFLLECGPRQQKASAPLRHLKLLALRSGGFVAIHYFEWDSVLAFQSRFCV